MAESPSELQNEIEKLEMKHAEHPEGRFFVPLANAYRKTGETATAEALLREGLRLHPDYLSAHIVLGRCLADRGATEEATEEFEYVLSMDPQNLIALRTLGELAMNSGRSDEARRWYEELLDVDPMNDEARRALEAVPSSTSDDDFRDGGGWWEPPAGEVKEIPPAEADWAIEEESEELPFIEREPVTPRSQLAEPYGSYIDPVDEERAPDDGLEEDPLAFPPGEPVTETIAELYARQGLVDRAADVYRELIRRRGGDAALERRLADLVSSTASSTTEDAPMGQRFDALTTPFGSSPPAAPSQTSATPSFAEAEPLEQGFPAEEGVAPVEESDTVAESPQGEPHAVADAGAEAEDAGAASVAPEVGSPGSDAFSDSFADGFDVAPPAESTSGTTIAGFIAGLVAWRRSEEVGSGEPTGESAMPEVSGFEIVEPEAEPWTPIPEEPFILEEPAAEAWVGEDLPVAVTGPTHVAPADLQPEDAFPWETISASETVRSDQPAAEPAGDSADELVSFDNFLGDSDVDSAPSAPSSTPPEPPSATVASDEEDDLESFQAWLRSLKR